MAINMLQNMLSKSSEFTKRDWNLLGYFSFCFMLKIIYQMKNRYHKGNTDALPDTRSKDRKTYENFCAFTKLQEEII
jgi:hypothetical protein